MESNSCRLIVICIVPFAIISLAPNTYVGPLVKEDGAVEWIGALAWLLAACFFAGTLVRTWRSGKSGRKITSFWLSCLALITFLAAGEEISWGQRLINYETPGLIAKHNLQKEMNLHNLTPLDTRVNDQGEKKTGLARWLTFGRLGTLVWVGYLVVLPLAFRFIKPARDVLRWTGLPVPPLFVAFAGIATYIAFRVVRTGSEILVADADAFKLMHVSANEVKETVVAVLFLVAAACVWRTVNRLGSPSAFPDP